MSTNPAETTNPEDTTTLMLEILYAIDIVYLKSSVGAIFQLFGFATTKSLCACIFVYWNQFPRRILFTHDAQKNEGNIALKHLRYPSRLDPIEPPQ